MNPRTILFACIAVLGLVAASSAGKKDGPKPAEPPATPAPAPAPVKPSPLKPLLELLDFGGDWCQYCRAQDHIIKGIEADGIRVHRHDKGTPQARQYHVTAYPTYVILRNGKEIDRVVGQTTAAELRRKVGLDQSSPLSPGAIPVVGPKGYRLRLFYPAGDAAGEKLVKMITRRMPVITKQYGFDHDTTGSVQCTSWEAPKDQVTLLLADASDRIVYYQHEFPHDAATLREELKAAAAGTINVAGDCPKAAPPKPVSNP